VQRKVPLHVNDFDIKGLRHLRTTELSSVNGFRGEELARYFGWTMGAVGISNMVDRYEMKNWKKYGQRLLTRPPWGPAPLYVSQGNGGHRPDTLTAGPPGPV